MQFSSKEDIGAPIADVFRQLSDFHQFEAAARARGVDLHRLRKDHPTAEGLEWSASFSLRGKTRQARITLSAHEPPASMRFDTMSKGLDGVFTLNLTSLSPTRTRMAVVLHLAPRTLPARMLLQSLRLQKGKLNRRFKLRVAERARELEVRLSPPDGGNVTKA